MESERDATSFGETTVVRPLFELSRILKEVVSEEDSVACSARWYELDRRVADGVVDGLALGHMRFAAVLSRSKFLDVLVAEFLESGRGTRINNHHYALNTAQLQLTQEARCRSRDPDCSTG